MRIEDLKIIRRVIAVVFVVTIVLSLLVAVGHAGAEDGEIDVVETVETTHTAADLVSVQTETTLAPETSNLPSFSITFIFPETEKVETEVETTVPVEPETVAPSETDTPAAIDRYACVPLSDNLKQFIIDECAKYDLSPALVFAIIYKETGYGTYKAKYDPETERYTVKGDSGKSYGLMQIQLRYVEKEMKLLGCDDLCDNFQNVRVGIYLLAQKMEWAAARWLKYAENCAILAYNRGNGGATTYIRAYGAKRVKKNSYVKKVLAEIERIEQCQKIGEEYIVLS